MDFWSIVLNIFFGIFVYFSVGWTLIAWGLGLVNFTEKHGEIWGKVGTYCWYLLFFIHVVVLCLAWFQSVSAVWLAFFLLCLHAIFGAIFGRNVSAA